MAKRVRTPRLPKGPPKARPTKSADNPRHVVWVDDDGGLLAVTASDPGQETLALAGVTYRHTRELPTGQWVYTKEAP